MKRLFIAVLGVIALTLAWVLPASAGTYSSAAPKPPSGWTVSYARNFITGNTSGWVLQPGAGAQVVLGTKPGSEFGLGIKLTAKDQWAEFIGPDVVGSKSFVQELVFVPPVPGTTEAANWPAWWTSNQPWPSSGEIDMLEGIRGNSGFHTHYGATAATEINSPNLSAPGNNPGTNWLTISMLRENGVVKEWYNGTYLGQVPLPPTATERLQFQNQSYSSGQGPASCPQCFGPYVPATAWLSRVTVYAP